MESASTARPVSHRPGFVLLWFCRSVVALTWLYNGLGLKLLDSAGHHQNIVAEATGLSPRLAATVTTAIGLAECFLAGAVLTGRRPYLIGGIQVACVMAMNAGGLLGAGSLIVDTPALVVQNLGFAGLVAAVAYLGGQNHARQA